MTRGLGVVVDGSHLPEWLITLAGVVTQLGDLWFVLAIVIVVILMGTRQNRMTRTPIEDSAFLLALGLGAFALTIILKAAFALPRPPGATSAVIPVWVPPPTAGIYESFVTASGFGFPSGHALKSTAVYGGAALLFRDVARRRIRILAATTIVGLIGGSRIILGVHYTIDVLVGTVCGVLFLWAMWTSTRRSPRRALGVTAGLGVVATVVTLDSNAVLVVGGAAIALVAWRYWRSQQATQG